MIVYNHMRGFECKSPEFFLHFLAKSIPRYLKPKIGFPDFHVTNSIFHSYGVMYKKYTPSGEKEEEDSFDFNRKNNVWAFTVWNKNQINGTTKGDVYISLKERIEKNSEYRYSIEHVVFHEIGHQFYIGNDIILGKSENIDFEHEFLSDIYANACMICLHKKHKEYDGYYFPFNKRTKTILEKTEKMKINGKNVLSIAEMVWRKYGVI